MPDLFNPESPGRLNIFPVFCILYFGITNALGGFLLQTFTMATAMAIALNIHESYSYQIPYSFIQ